MSVKTITPYLVKATLNGDAGSLNSITVQVKAPSGGQYVIGGRTIAGGALADVATRTLTGGIFETTASVNGQITRIS